MLAHELTHVAQAQRGLHRKASFDGGMPFAEEHEAEAEATEAEVLQEAAGGAPGEGASTTQAAASDAGTSNQAEQHREALERIRERVLELAAEAARIHAARNGVHRRF